MLEGAPRLVPLCDSTMKASRTVVIVNPAARNGWVRKNWDGLSRSIEASLGRVEFRLTGAPGDAANIVEEVGRDGAGRLVSFGGDGTHGEVAEGLMRLEPGRRPPLGVLHAGTGGDFRKMLRRSDSLEEACRVIATSEPEPIDVGRVSYLSHAGEPEVRHFLNVASLGMGGFVDKAVNRSKKRFGGRVAFAAATVKVSATYRPARVRVHLDGSELGTFSISNVCVCNGRWAGGGMMFAPKARLADGLFEVVIIRHASTLRSLPVAAGLYKGTHIYSDLVSMERAASVKIEPLTDAEAWMDIDGEAPGRAPASFDMLPGAISVFGVKEGFR